ncbi:MAG: CD1247 N-terminal domain-containing protein, partial [Sarcina sp.]
NVETIDETVTLLNDDLSGVQDELFEELTLEELEDHEEEYCEVVCENCNKTLYVEKEMLSGKEEIPCPYCNKNFKA